MVILLGVGRVDVIVEVDRIDFHDFLVMWAGCLIR